MDASRRTVFEKLRAFRYVSLPFLKYINFLFSNMLNICYTSYMLFIANFPRSVQLYDVPGSTDYY
jgi:hypothetical protein